MTDGQRKQFIEEQIGIFPADCEMGEFLRDIAKLQPCDDAISRQAVLDEIFGSRKNFNNEFDQGFFADKIRALPPVTPQQRIGHWEWIQYDGNPNIGNWHCSECNRIVRGAITVASPVYSYKYCPNCGAKMQEVNG